MKTVKSITKKAAIVLLVATILAGCGTIQPQRFGKNASGAAIDTTLVDENGNTKIDNSLLSQALEKIPAGELSEAEANALIFMREEEKLAHDVYVALGDIWGLNIFSNISQSEATHTDAVKNLIDRYGLSDPAADKAPGEFVNAELQELYNQLVAQGSQSLADALRVGATIEDLDIVDLQTRIAQTERSDIQLVYENLMKGSRNHLRSFTKTLAKQTGESYQPQYLEQAEFDAIINSDMERGQGQGKGR